MASPTAAHASNADDLSAIGAALRVATAYPANSQTTTARPMAKYLSDVRMTLSS
jgi:hypothetical protein